MVKKGVEHKPSETAFFAALRRALANKEYNDDKFGPDYMAEFFLPSYFRFFLRFKKIRENARYKLDGFFPGLTEYMIARTAYFDGLFKSALEIRAQQIVLLGAGYDTRAYRFAGLNQGTQIFELDIASTQDQKKKCLKRAVIDIPNQVKLVPIDFNKKSLSQVLAQAGYDGRKKTLFIWEGVSYYLDTESVDATLEFISHLPNNDSAIAFDYTVTLTEDTVYYGAQDFARSMEEHHSAEALLFSVEEGKIETFLESRGLKMTGHLDNREIESTFLMDDNGSLIGPMTGHFRFVLASPR
ncbi:MAG: SAM-dependent methyltransferase [Anaerolineales bacterium]|nr:SAM-dependent methyltransferase [Anaerolineales bacterium]